MLQGSRKAEQNELIPFCVKISAYNFILTVIFREFTMFLCKIMLAQWEFMDYYYSMFSTHVL